MLGGGVTTIVSWDIIDYSFPPYLMILIEQISWDLRKATFLANQYKEYDWNVWKQVKKSNQIKLKIQSNESHILFKWIPRYWHRCGAIEFVWKKSGCSWQRHHLKSLFGHLDSRCCVMMWSLHYRHSKSHSEVSEFSTNSISPPKAVKIFWQHFNLKFD